MLAAGALTLLGLAALAGPAHAAGQEVQPELGSVTLENTSPGDPLKPRVGDTLRITATFAIPARAAEPTDYFTFAVPTPPLRIVPYEFAIADAASPDILLAQCLVAPADPTAGTTTITCTLTEDYNPDLPLTGGAIQFDASVAATTVAAPLTFALGEQEADADIPGGRLRDRVGLAPAPFDPPTEASKQGNISSSLAANGESRIQWVVGFAGSDLPDAAGATLTDTMLIDTFDWTGGRLLADEPFDVFRVPNTDYYGTTGAARDYYWGEGYDVRRDSGYAVTPTATGFALAFDESVLADRADYRFLVFYFSDVPADLDAVSNTLVGLREDLVGILVLHAEGSGEQPTAQLSWTKVDGDGAALGGATFAVTGPDDAVTVVTDNDAADLDPADGTIALAVADGEYSITETLAPAGYVRAEDVWTVTVSEDQVSAQAVVPGPRIVNERIAAEGPQDAAPLTQETLPADAPDPAETAETPASPALAQTGAAGVGARAGIAAALLLIGAAAVAASLRLRRS